MAAALFNACADPARATAFSAGTQPAGRIHPEVAASMEELGIRLGESLPTRLTPGLARSADLLVTMGCGESCPHVPGLRRLDWELADPKGQPAAEVRRIRDEIQRRVVELIRAEGWQRR